MMGGRRGQEAGRFFEDLDRDAISRAIREAESKGYGEIRVHIHHGRTAEPRREAERVFQKLGMERTARQSGCLIFIAPAERAFAVIGDTGIHERVGDAFWLEARDAAAGHFAAGRFTEGIVAAVSRLGEALAAHFPLAAGAANTNELPDDVSEG
jgi:uncharacterized membrane protein